MKRITLFAIALATAFAVQAQQKVKSEIKKVTVFAASAQVARETKVTLEKGEQQLILTDLSTQINVSSLRVRPDNREALIRQISYETVLEEDEVNKTAIEALHGKLEAEKRNLEVLDARKSALLREREFLAKNMTVNGNNGMQMTLAQFQQTENFYRTKTESIQTELYDLEVKRKAQLNELNKLVLEIKKAGSRKITKSGQLSITIDATKSMTTTLFVDYLVNNAGWTPEYELRVDEVGKPVALELKAKLVQLTDVDWKKVNLTFSTGDPNRGSQAPELMPWYITQPVAKPAVYSKPPIQVPNQGYTGRFYGTIWDAQTNEPLIGSSIVFYAANGEVVSGVSADFDGSYSFLSNKPVQKIQVSFIGYQSQLLNAPANGQLNVRLQPETSLLNEVMVTSNDVANSYIEKGMVQSISYDGYAVENMPARARRDKAEQKAKVTTYNARQVRKAITQTFEAKTPYTVKSDGKEIAISLQEFELPVSYSYLAIPKLDNDAFLEAKLFGWDTLGLISGNIKVFIEGSFVGNSALDANTLEDTLSFSLGRDPNVVLKRVEVPGAQRKSFFGSKRIRTVAYRIEVRNNKKVPITLVLQDQFPLSPSDDIEIKRGDTQGGKVDGETGIITWEVEVKPGEQISRTFSFEVTYPKSIQVYF